MADMQVCELTKIIVNDGVTIIPGHVECDDNECKVWVSDDPNNEKAKQIPYLLHNRVAYKRVDYTLPVVTDTYNKCFVSEEAMQEYVDSRTSDLTN